MTFKSWLDYSNFSKKVRSQRRYILDHELEEFLNEISNSCHNRIKTLQANSTVWRAQIGCDEKDETKFIENLRVPYSFKRMKPLINSASEGRVNPKGIPCLYVATDTAIHETRPWPGLVVTIAKLKLIRELRLIDFSVTAHAEQFLYAFFDDGPIDERAEAVWAAMDRDFSSPVTVSDSQSDYAPTQIISEFFKSKGFDGIAYKSSLTKGHNYAIFDLNDANVVQCDLYEVSKVKYAFERIDDVSSIKDKDSRAQ